MTLASPLNLESKRQQLQKRRRVKFWQATWRFSFASSVSLGLFWLITLPSWVLESQTQIKVSGNQFLTEDEIRSLVPLTYPQPILQLQTQELSEHFKQQAPVAKVTATRQFFPPKLNIEVQERPPVAIALATDSQTTAKSSKEIGFLDQEGILVPADFYSQIEQASLPTLKVIGFQQQYQSYWQKIYPLINQSRVKVFEVDWRNRNNLTLNTELGKVYLGSDLTLVEEQLAVLFRLKQLSAQVKSHKIAYIDLTNPQFPELQVAEKP